MSTSGPVRCPAGRPVREIGTCRSVDPSLLWQELPAALDVVGRVDRVELKAIVDGRMEDALAVLDVEVEPPSLRRVHYLDTADLALAGQGIFVRTRELREAGCGRRRADVEVKLRRPAFGKRDRARGLVVELDARPAAITWTASMRRLVDPGQVRTGLTGRGPVVSALTRAQRRLLRSLVDGAVELQELVPHGPVEVVRLRSAGSGDRVGVEWWHFPDGTRIVELSVKCRPARSQQLADAVRARITERGLAISGRQPTKAQFSLQLLRRPDDDDADGDDPDGDDRAMETAPVPA